MTVDELIEKITSLQHKEAVYTEACAYLEEFLPSDVDDDDPDTIAAPGCVVPEVSFDAIEEVIEQLCLVRDGLSQEVDTLKTMEITENGGSDGKRDSGSGQSGKRNKGTGKQRKRSD